MGELFTVQVDGSKMRLAALGNPTMGGCTVFCGLDKEVWKPTMSFLHSP